MVKTGSSIVGLAIRKSSMYSHLKTKFNEASYEKLKRSIFSGKCHM